MLGVSVSEVHRYPLRPKGFEEPLFPTTASRRSVVEHLSEAPWLVRASELKGSSGEASHALNEPVRLKNLGDKIELVRSRTRKRRSRSKKRIVEVLDRWREVREWWDEDNRVDRMVFRLLLEGGAVVEVARERHGWFLVGVVD